MKILHPILCYYPSQAGGPANTLYWLNNALSKTEFKTVVVSTKFGIAKPLNSLKFTANQKVVFLETKGKAFIKSGIKQMSGCDVVQFSSLFFPPTLPLLLKAVMQRKAIIISPRGELYASALSQKAMKKKVWKGLVGLFQKHINFHATNTFEKGIIQQHFPKAKSVTLIPNYIKLEQKLDVEIKDQFVFVGRINPIKNIDLLIHAFSELLKSNVSSNYELLIVGSARLPYELEYEVLLKDLIMELNLQDHVKLLGHLEGEDKHQIIASSKALVLPSKSENFGNVVLEALAQGTPVIASKNTPWEILEQHNSGYWVEGNIESLTLAMQHLAVMQLEHFYSMRTNAYTLCKSKFDIQTNSHVWENYYKKITSDV